MKQKSPTLSTELRQWGPSWGVACIIHVAACLFFWINGAAGFQKPIVQKLTIRTVALPHDRALSPSIQAFLDQSIAVAKAPPPASPVTTPLTQAPPSPLKQPSTLPAEKKKIPSKPPLSPPSKKNVPAPTKAKNPAPSKTASSPPKPEQEKALALMKQTLARLENASQSMSTGKTLSPISPLKKLESLGSEQFSMAAAAAAAAAYQEEIAAYLKHLLELPELGEVKMRLTVKRDGKVSQVAIISSTSDKNTHYVETKVPTLSFPPFGDRLKNEAQHTFPVTLSSKFSQ